MAKSRLHELSEHGVSVWIDSISREWIEDGFLAKLMRDDAVVGVTSNPTIFQKAMAEGDRYDAQLREVAQQVDDPTEIFFALAAEDIRDACDILRPVWDEGGGQDGYVSLEVDPGLAYDRERDTRAGAALSRGDRPPEPVRQDPRHRARPRRDRGRDRAGQVDQRHAHLLARPLPRRRRGVHPRARAARGGGRRPVPRRLRGELLRLARRHRGGQAPRGDRQRRAARGSSRSRTRSSPTSTTSRRSRGERWERLAAAGRGEAALPLGLDLDEEPRLPRRHVRRGADRAGDGQHDAARDDRGLPGSRRGARRHAARGRRRGERSCSRSCARPASTTTT